MILLNFNFKLLASVAILIFTVIHDSGVECQPKQRLTKNFVRVEQLSNSHLNHGDTLSVTYSCSFAGKENVVGFEILVDNGVNRVETILTRLWPCINEKLANKSLPSRVEQRQIVVHLPDRFRFRPDMLNSKDYSVVSKAKLRTWMMDKLTYDRLKKSGLDQKAYDKSFESMKSQLFVKLQDPYSRSSRLSYVCLSFIDEILYKKELKSLYQCSREAEIVELISFPLPLNNQPHGKLTEIKPYSDIALEHDRLYRNKNFQFSLELWLYAEDYCPSGAFCAIYQRINSSSKRRTPNIFFTQQGHIFVELFDKHIVPHGAQTNKIIPLHDWCRLLFAFRSFKWELIVHCMSNFSEPVLHADHYYPARNIIYDDVDAYAFIGGSSMTLSFKGYVGKAILYRHLLIDPKNLKPVASDHPMFKLDLKNWNNMCFGYLKSIRYFTYRIALLKEYLDSKNKCPVREFWKPRTQGSKQNQCSIFGKLSYSISSQDMDLYKQLRRQILFNSNKQNESGAFLGQLNRQSIGKYLLANTIAEIKENGFVNMNAILKNLRESSCLGNHESSYIISVIYTHGIVIEASNLLSSFYLMRAVLDKDRMSLLTLGHKHTFGLDGIPIDYDQAFYFYIQMAEKAKIEFYNPVLDEVYPSFVRLTDKSHLDHMMTDDNDVFSWLKDQAKKGVDSSQRKLAEALFWGFEGVKRNLDAGFQLFKRGAERKDPALTFNYGLSLLNGQGTNKNVEAAMEQFENAAKLGHSTSYAALGYHAFEIEHNATKAAHYWNQGWEKYRDVDCAFNIGYLFYFGKFPNQPANLHKAWEFWEYAAKKGQIDAQVWVAYYLNTGLNVIMRDGKLANEWARYVGERSSAAGKYLQQGILAYQNKNWPLAILYYLMTATAGLEIGSFNAAFLCEENPDNIVSSLFQIECTWRYYNQSVTKNPPDAQPYALNKMGDYHLSRGVAQRRSSHELAVLNSDLQQAADYYVTSYLKGELHGLFNLAVMIEEGVRLPSRVWKKIGLRDISSASNFTQLLAIYDKCLKNELHDESFIPCTIAYYSTKFKQILFEYNFIIKFTIVSVITVSLGILAAIFRTRFL